MALHSSLVLAIGERFVSV
uniref:Uncharacterized protein n=1 Tax=Schistosoma japonicum TaxID=6182 RepID=Q5BQQ0_SCHJA|nr:unknown [Schistosoma japonicum]